MAYTRGPAAVGDFYDYDLTPYRGGYDLSLTYGRPLKPSNDICYPNSSSSSSNIDYNRPHYATHCEPSAYRVEASRTEYNSYARPKPKPGPGPAFDFQPGRPPLNVGEYGYGGRPNPQHDYGFPPGVNLPGQPGSGYGSGYGRPGFGEEPPHRMPDYEQWEEGEEMRRVAYGKPGYGGQEEEYQRHSFERPEEEKYRRPVHGEEPGRFQSRSYEGEAYGRQKHGDNFDDDEEKKHQHHKHQHHHHRHH